jgi:SAM-dependent methyltransferase
MTDTPPRISVAHNGEGARLHAPAAERNADAILDLLRAHAPASGTALEIASGTGQHVTRFACALPGLTWQPTEISDERRASIAAWSTDAPAGAILSPLHLDATTPGWSATHKGFALILLVNLLHLIPTDAARTLIAEAAQALAPGGRFIVYGPFLRNGTATSDGDARFDAAIRADNPDAGYKNDTDMLRWAHESGLDAIARTEMPANNLALVMVRSKDAS